MPTPMSAYAEIAARYHVDPSDEDAVTRFFQDTAPALPAEERRKIFDELLAAQESDGGAKRQRYTAGTPETRPEPPRLAPVPPRAFNPHRDGDELETIARSITRWIDHYFRLSGLGVNASVRAGDGGKLVVCFAGPDAARLTSDRKHLLQSLKALLAAVAEVQPVLDMIEISVAPLEDRDGARVLAGPRQLVGSDVGPRVVAMDNIAVSLMSVEDAARTLERSRDEFIVFRDAATEKVRVIYKRSDENLGLISAD